MDDISYLLHCVHNILDILSRVQGVQNGHGDFQLLVCKVDFLQRILVNLDVDDFITETIGRAHSLLVEMERTENSYGGFSASVQQDGRCGRPSYVISKEQLSYLIEQGFKLQEIADMLDVSCRTVKRRMMSYGLRVSGTYSTIDDNQLDELTRQACDEHPGIGIRILKGFLLSKGFRVQRERIRLSLLRIDPIGIVQRWKSTVRRRQYNVKHPLSLWHIDGNHKLIRWRIVVHGGIDGYSRVPVYLKASSNNRADTVLALFREAVAEFGLPARVRSDKGGENVDVSTYMLSHVQRGPGRGSMLTGKSTHNQRIERLWRDVFAGCLSLFYDLFYDLERQNILHPDNEGHLWCLHYVFLPIINKHLTNWKNAWVYHPMRTERNKSPMQLWIRGLQEAWGSQSLEDEVFQNEGSDYGIDWSGPIPQTDASLYEMVEVPDTACPLTLEQMDLLPATENMNYLDGVETLQQILNIF